MEMEFFSWKMLGSCAGAALAVGTMTQLTKELPLVRCIPTQIWSYLLALAILMLAQAFSAGLTMQGAALAVLNAGIVSLSANGGYAALERMQNENEKEQA